MRGRIQKLPDFREVFYYYTAMEKKLTNIRNWEESQRPREKFLLKGGDALSTEELLAIIIGSGTKDKNAIELSREILYGADNNLNNLSRFTIEDFCRFGGIGTCKAVSLMAVFELSKRYQICSAPNLPQIYSSEAAAKIMQPLLKNLSHEECWVMYLNRNNRLIGKERLSIGGISATVLDVKLIIKKAMAKLSSAIILVHNHPSGNHKPGKEDISQTKKLAEASKMCDLSLLDHIIVAGNSYFSFSDNGAL